MSWLKNTFTSSIGRKFAMALSALFLMVFLLQHFMINIMSVFSESTFNDLSHFMGNSPIIQYGMQPILIAGVVFHFVMGIVLELKNKAARNTKYAMYKGAANSTWVSRNMIYTGMVILLFLGLHFYDYWIPEMIYKYVDVNPLDAHRYYEETIHKFHSPVRVGIYVLAFVFLMLHLLHGFQSAFQSVGARHPKYTPIIKGLGKCYAIIIPLGFIFIAIYHFIKA